MLLSEKMRIINLCILASILVGAISCDINQKNETVSEYATKETTHPAAYTYFVESPWFEKNADEFFKDTIWTKLPPKPEHDCSEIHPQNCIKRPGWPPTLVYANGNLATQYSRNVVGVKISNRFKYASAAGIDNKEKLFQRLRGRDEVKPYLPRQVEMNYEERGKPFTASVASFLHDVRYYILKPTDSYGSYGIKVAASTNDSQKDIEDHMSAYKHHRNWVLQEYLADPLLYNGKKFHLRMYALVIRSSKTREVKVFTYPDSWVYTAPQPYGTPTEALANLDDNKRHITNISAGGQGAPFPHAFKNPEVDDQFNIEPLKTTITEQFRHLVWESLRDEKDKLRCMPGIRTGCFDILGYDIIVERSTAQLKMLEINLDVGFNFVKYDMNFEREWRSRFVSDLLQTVLKTLLDDRAVKGADSRFELLTEENVKKLPEAIKVSKAAARLAQ